MTPSTLLISGGVERPDGFSLGEGKYYQRAVLLELNLESGEYKCVLEKSEGSPPNYPAEHPNLQFTSGHIEGDTLWLPTDTEIYKIGLANYQIEQVISHPCFQNIHSVHVINGELVATSTGLDNVVFMDKTSGDVLRIQNAEGKDPWHRFDPDINYREIHSTRPHDCHPNFVFELSDDLWVTRCKQEDAFCLSNTSRTLDITRDDAISIHDGIKWNGKLIFTRVDGQLVLFKQNGRYIETIDPFKGSSNRPVGWCRGLCVSNGIFYMGFSKIRKTKLKDKLKFLAKGNFAYHSGNYALVAAYDISKQKIVRTYETAPGTVDAIYGVMTLSPE